MIRIVLSGDRVENGGRAKGSVTWQPEASKVPRSVEVICRWRIEGRGKGREEVVGQTGRTSPEGETVIPFDFEIPLYGPLSYEGKLLRIIWEVAAHADLPMARDEHEVQPFTVVARKWDPKEWEEEDDDDLEDGMTEGEDDGM